MGVSGEDISVSFLTCAVSILKALRAKAAALGAGGKCNAHK
jgi:hypothetical protein